MLNTVPFHMPRATHQIPYTIQKKTTCPILHTINYTLYIYIYIYIYTYTLYRYTVESSLCKMLCTVHWLYSICHMPNATRYMLHYTQITIPCTLYTIHYAICTPCTMHCILIYIHFILTVYYFVLCNLYWLLLYTCMTIHTYIYIYICTFIRTKYVLCTMHWVLCTMHWVLCTM